MFDFYLDIIEESFETIVFIKKIKIPEELNKHFFSYHDFSELEEELQHVVVRQIKSTTIRHFILTGIAEKRSNKAYYKHLIRQIK